MLPSSASWILKDSYTDRSTRLHRSEVSPPQSSLSQWSSIRRTVADLVSSMQLDIPEMLESLQLPSVTG